MERIKLGIKIRIKYIKKFNLVKFILGKCYYINMYKTNFKSFETKVFNFLNIENLCFEKFEIFEQFPNVSKKQITKVLNNLLKKQIINFDLFQTYYVFSEP